MFEEVKIPPKDESSDPLRGMTVVHSLADLFDVTDEEMENICDERISTSMGDACMAFHTGNSSSVIRSLRRLSPHVAFCFRSWGQTRRNAKFLVQQQTIETVNCKQQEIPCKKFEVQVYAVLMCVCVCVRNIYHFIEVYRIFCSRTVFSAFSKIETAPTLADDVNVSRGGRTAIS